MQKWCTLSLRKDIFVLLPKLKRTLDWEWLLNSISQASRFHVTLKNEGSENVTGLKIYNRTGMVYSCTRPCSVFSTQYCFQNAAFLIYAGNSDNTWAVIMKPIHWYVHHWFTFLTGNTIIKPKYKNVLVSILTWHPCSFIRRFQCLIVVICRFSKLLQASIFKSVIFWF